MKFLAKLALALTVLAGSFAVTSVSNAADPFGPSFKDEFAAPEAKNTWTGVYLGAGIGYQVNNTEIENGINPIIDAWLNGTLNDDSSNGWKYGIRAGFDWQVGESPFVLGVLGGYDWNEHNFDAWYLGARAGVVVIDNALVYAGYAYGQGDYETAFSDNTLDMHTLLTGVELRLTKSLSAGLEYNYTMYEDISLFNSNVSADTDTHAVTLRLNWRPGFFN